MNTAVHDKQGDRALAEKWRNIHRCAVQFIQHNTAVPPFTSEQLFEMADRAAHAAGLTPDGDRDRKIMALMIHNAAWSPVVAGIPFERRLLLLPQCFRRREDCPAAIDDYGLLCRECGRCPLGALQHEALDLGYTVLIAEGTGAVTGLLREGLMDAIIGASCLPALEQSFRHITEEAVPSLAVPLLREGCNATAVDLEMLRELMRLRSNTAAAPGVSPDHWRNLVQTWFEPQYLQKVMPGTQHAQRMAVAWVAAAGKRWRPLLTAAVYDALQSATDRADTRIIAPIAIAAECFHKASLIHDDIEDGDLYRDGRPTLHAQYNLPLALNAGDLLLGEGYRLLAEAPLPPATRLRLLQVAAEGHRRLCIGQGEELSWRTRPEPPDTAELLDLFQLKTAPAFEVALQLGAIAGGAGPRTCGPLADFSRVLGIAYQIRDDLSDMARDLPTGREQRPSILLALLLEHCDQATRDLIRRRDAAAADLRAQYEKFAIPAQAERMFTDYRNRTLQALTPLTSIRLKSILVRLVKRILPHVR